MNRKNPVVKLDPATSAANFFLDHGFVFYGDNHSYKKNFFVGNVYDKNDTKIKEARRFLLVKLAPDMVLWRKIFSIKVESIAQGPEVMTFIVVRRADLERVQILADKLSELTRQSFYIKLEYDEDSFYPSGVSWSDKEIDMKFYNCMTVLVGITCITLIVLAAVALIFGSLRLLSHGALSASVAEHLIISFVVRLLIALLFRI